MGLCVYRGMIAIVPALPIPLLAYQTFLSASAYHVYPLSTSTYDIFIKSKQVLGLLHKLNVIYIVLSQCNVKRVIDKEKKTSVAFQMSHPPEIMIKDIYTVTVKLVRLQSQRNILFNVKTGSLQIAFGEKRNHILLSFQFTYRPSSMPLNHLILIKITHSRQPCVSPSK